MDSADVSKQKILFLCRLAKGGTKGARLSKAVRWENLLQQTHIVALPEHNNRLPGQVPGTPAKTAIAILCMFQPRLLDEHIPLQSYGDGNCFFRAISRALYGHEEQHLLLRLKTALEIASHPAYYDQSLPDYHDLVGGKRIDVPAYKDILKTARTPGAYQELIQFYATSAVIGKPILSFFPNSNVHFAAWTRRVAGRNVRNQPGTMIKILWSAMRVPRTASVFNGNHFVFLHLTSPPTQVGAVVDLTDTKVTASDTAAPSTSTKTKTHQGHHQ